VCGEKEPRELTREDRAEIKRLVTALCANYHRLYGCLPLEGACYMLGKWYTGAYCKYFREAVLPLNPELAAALMDGRSLAYFKECAVCGASFIPEGRKIYCSDACRIKGNREMERKKKRKQRRNRR
jgi:predicted nucleic acid-binding Zn ribbon protein